MLQRLRLIDEKCRSLLEERKPGYLALNKCLYENGQYRIVYENDRVGGREVHNLYWKGIHVFTSKTKHFMAKIRPEELEYQDFMMVIGNSCWQVEEFLNLEEKIRV